MTHDEDPDDEVAADDAANDVEVNPQVRWTEQRREQTFEFIWPEWHALQELARFHGWRSPQLSMGQSWSAEEARVQYLALMRPGNPLSPQASLPRRTTVDVQIRSVSSLSVNTAMVRFSTVRTDPGARRQVARRRKGL